MDSVILKYLVSRQCPFCVRPLSQCADFNACAQTYAMYLGGEYATCRLCRGRVRTTAYWRHYLLCDTAFKRRIQELKEETRPSMPGLRPMMRNLSINAPDDGSAGASAPSGPPPVARSRMDTRSVAPASTRIRRRNHGPPPRPSLNRGGPAVSQGCPVCKRGIVCQDVGTCAHKAMDRLMRAPAVPTCPLCCERITKRQFPSHLGACISAYERGLVKPRTTIATSAPVPSAPAPIPSTTAASTTAPAASVEKPVARTREIGTQTQAKIGTANAANMTPKIALWPHKQSHFIRWVPCPTDPVDVATVTVRPTLVAKRVLAIAPSLASASQDGLYDDSEDEELEREIDEEEYDSSATGPHDESMDVEDDGNDDSDPLVIDESVRDTEEVVPAAEATGATSQTDALTATHISSTSDGADTDCVMIL